MYSFLELWSLDSEHLHRVNLWYPIAPPGEEREKYNQRSCSIKMYLV